MTNRTYTRPISAGVPVKRPRVKKYDLMFDEHMAQPCTSEGLNNGIRPHGGYRGNYIDISSHGSL